MNGAGKGPLHEMTVTGPTEFWNDSCSQAELSSAIEYGATGGTSNPTIVGQVLKKEFERWKPKIIEFAERNPVATEDDIAWKTMEEITVNAAKLLRPIFDKNGGRNGRLSIQTNTKYYRDARALAEQALYFNTLYPNNNIKLPATRAGIEAIEELSYRGVSVNATVSFTVPQAVAVAQAVERGMERREKEGMDVSSMSPVCTIMVGRLDDWLKVVAAKKGIITDPGYLEWAGVAVAKRAYRIYRERGYRTRILNAAYRNHFHWSEFIGGDMSMTIPYEWQRKFNASDIKAENRIDDPVDPKIISGLERKFPDFRRALDERGMDSGEFEHFGATRRTLLAFLESYADLVSVIRGVMIRDPDAGGE
ncbi:MAG: transaldolase family protein [Treponema sp.]|jgi:transaldolase|nr:transaldolase family protein [Treponema sp.]